VALALCILAIVLGVTRLAVLGGIFTGAMPRQTISSKTQAVLVIDLLVTYFIGGELARITHSGLTSFLTNMICLAYLFTIAIRFAAIMKQEYKPTVAELAVYAMLQVALLITCMTAVLAS